MRHFAIMSFCIFICQQISTTHSEKCIKVQIRNYRKNLRCVATTGYMANLTIPRHLCTWNCLHQQDCSLTNYKYVYNYCLMSNGKCDKLEKDIEFQVAYFRATGQGCLSWAALPDYETELTVILRPSGQDMAPGRYVLPSSDVVPGKLYIHKNIFYTVYKGEGLQLFNAYRSTSSGRGMSRDLDELHSGRRYSSGCCCGRPSIHQRIF